MTKRKINIFGTSGSIGQSTLKVLRESKEAYEFVTFSAYDNVEQLIADCLEFRPRYANIGNKKHFWQLKNALSDTNITASYGKESLLDLACINVDWSMSAIIGFAGVEVSLRCAEYSNVLALANKETLVCAGRLLLNICKTNKTKLIPVDSEHSAIFQCLEGERRKDLKSIILTASGGAFRDWSLEEMKSATLKQALKHPNWSMGTRITIDSASMFNKALELIEAMHLFGLKFSEIEVIIHPQSIIHSMVEFNDGSIKAQMGVPDMKVPIQYALTYPSHYNAPWERLDFLSCGDLTFQDPDLERFPSLKLAYNVLKTGGTASAALNLSNDYSVKKFLERKIKFTDIYRINCSSIQNHPWIEEPNLYDLTQLEKWVKKHVNEF